MKTAKPSNNRPTFTIACEPEKNVNEITNVDFGQNPKKKPRTRSTRGKGKSEPGDEVECCESWNRRTKIEEKWESAVEWAWVEVSVVIVFFNVGWSNQSLKCRFTSFLLFPEPKRNKNKKTWSILLHRKATRPAQIPNPTRLQSTHIDFCAVRFVLSLLHRHALAPLSNYLRL